MCCYDTIPLSSSCISAPETLYHYSQHSVHLYDRYCTDVYQCQYIIPLHQCVSMPLRQYVPIMPTEFTKQRGLSIHMARWCDGGRTQRSRLGTLTDKAVKTAKRRAAEATLGKVQIENSVLDNVYSFEYLGSRLQCDGDDEADVRYRMDIAQATFASLSHLWMDHRLSRNMKLRLYNLCVCSTLTHDKSCVANFKWF